MLDDRLLVRLNRRLWRIDEPSKLRAWKIMEEEALLIMGGEQLAPLRDKVMLTSITDGHFPDETPTDPERDARALGRQARDHPRDA